MALSHGGVDCWIVKTDAFGNLQWQRTYGGTFEDMANSIEQTADGGYIMAGTSASNNGDVSGNHGDKDFWVVKLSVSGDIEWQKSYGGDDKEVAYEIHQTTDGGYIVAGTTYSYDGVIMPVNGDVTGFHGGIDAWIVKISANGTLEWQKCMGANNLDGFLSVKQTTDGGYIAAGDYSNGNYYVAKFSATGGVEWEIVYTNYDGAHEIRQTPDGGYIIVGDIVSAFANTTGHNFGVLKISANGEEQWRKVFGGAGFFDIAFCVALTPDGGYAIAGVTNSYYSGNLGNTNGMQDGWVIKISSTGALLWQKPLGGSANDGANDIQVTPEGGFIVTGSTQSNNYDVSGNHGGSDVWVVKLGFGVLDTNDQVKPEPLGFFPNPARTRITFSQDVAAASIFSLNGSMVRQVVVKDRSLDVSDLATGTYLLQLDTENGSIGLKLVKE